MFIGPAVLSSLLIIVLKGRLVVRRVAERKQMAVQRLKEDVRGNRMLMRASLGMLAARFVLQHDARAYEELKSANDRHRYEGYGNILGIITEV